MSSMKLEMLLVAKDRASNVIKKLSQQVEHADQRADRVAKVAKATEQGNRRRQAAAQRLHQARQRLGVRSEHQIQREIKRTQAAYQRLASSGSASTNDINRAYASMTAKVRHLNHELATTSRRQQVFSRFKTPTQVVAGLAASVTAAGMVLAAPATRQMSYDRKLAMVANTAFSERGVAGRIAGKAELAKAIKQAVDTGGGKKENALSALDTLLASGSVEAKTAMNLLPTLQKASVATGASTEDLAKITTSAMQQFGIGESEIGKVLNMAVAAGQAGNFELADMARWLPQQMAAAKSTGMSGIADLQALLVANQQARVTAGSSDEAGNNLVNLLAKLTAKETNERFAKINYRDKDGKIKGIDYVGSMEKARKAGKNPMQAFMGIMDKVIGNDSRYQKLQSALKTAKRSEQKELLQQMTRLVEGTAIGKIISDRQALMALLGIRNNVKLGAAVADNISNSDKAIDTSHEVIAATNDFKMQQLHNAKDFAEITAMKDFNAALGSAAAKLSAYAQQYPELTSTLVGTAETLTAVAAAAGAAALSLRLLGGVGKGSKRLRKATTAAAEATSPGAANWLKWLSKFGAGASMLFLGGDTDHSQATQTYYQQKRRQDIGYLEKMIDSAHAFPKQIATYRNDLSFYADSPKKRALQKKLDAQAARIDKENAAHQQLRYQQSPAYYRDKRLSNIDYLRRLSINYPEFAKQYQKDLSHYPDSPQKRQIEKILNYQIKRLPKHNPIERLPDKPLSDKKIPKGVNEKIESHLSQLGADLNSRADLSAAAMKALANRPIVIQSTNHVYIDSEQVSETVSRHQGERLSRG